MKKISETIKLPEKGFTLIELLLVIAITAILATAVIVAIDPVGKFEYARDGVRERHIYIIKTATQIWYVDHEGMWGDLQLPDFSEEGKLVEICNTDKYSSEKCEEEGLVDLSLLTDEEYINIMPVDPFGGVSDYGTGYFIAEGSLFIVADKYEQKFLGIGMTEEEYLLQKEN